MQPASATRSTARSSRLPDFVVIGVEKGGTIALWENLNSHPQVYLPFDSGASTPREKHFFDWHWEKGLDWYRDQFDRPDQIQGEKTPTYLPELVCHARMAEAIPHSKLICLLRNPVTRAYSSWNMMRTLTPDHWNHTKLGFEDALWAIPKLLQRGHYATQLEHLFRFFPRDQVFVGISERFRANPQGEMARLLSFLGASSRGGTWGEHHARHYPSPMAEETQLRLQALYAPGVERLRTLLDDPIPEWS